MALREPITLTFGDQRFVVRPLTIGQVEQLEDLFARHAKEAFSNTRLAREAIGIALGRDDEAVDVADLECDVRELPVQLSAIMRLGGFVSVGEAPAAAEVNAQTGEPSEAA